MKKAYKLRRAGTGQSVQVMIPAIWAHDHGLKHGDSVMVEIENDRLIIKPLLRREGGKNEIDS